MVNDIILLKLDQDVALNENVQPACLPKDKDITYQKGKVFVAGKTISFSSGPFKTSTQMLLKKKKDLWLVEVLKFSMNEYFGVCVFLNPF